MEGRVRIQLLGHHDVATRGVAQHGARVPGQSAPSCGLTAVGAMAWMPVAHADLPSLKLQTNATLVSPSLGALQSVSLFEVLEGLL